MDQGRLVKTWEVSAFNRTTDEWETALNHAYDHTVPTEIPDFINQAPPHKINMTKRVRPVDSAETHIFYGDSHHPFQDRRAISLANLAVRAIHPNSVTYVGDDLDNAMFSTFDTRAEWANSTQKGIDEFSDQLAQTRADIGADGEIIVHEGNHNIRFARELRKYNAELLGIKRANAESALGVLSLDFLLRCEEMGVEYVSGYPEAEYWHNDNLKSYHGKVTNSSGLAVAKEIKESTVNFVHGHTHQAGIMYRQFKDGKELKTIWGMEVGTFADPNQIPSGSYSTNESGKQMRQSHNWHYGLGKVEDNVPSFMPIDDRGILIQGKWYNS